MSLGGYPPPPFYSVTEDWEAGFLHCSLPSYSFNTAYFSVL